MGREFRLIDAHSIALQAMLKVSTSKRKKTATKRTTTHEVTTVCAWWTVGLVLPLQPTPFLTSRLSSMADCSSRKGGCVWPAPVRMHGFGGGWFRPWKHGDRYRTHKKNYFLVCSRCCSQSTPKHCLLVCCPRQAPRQTQTGRQYLLIRERVRLKFERVIEPVTLFPFFELNCLCVKLYLLGTFYFASYQIAWVLHFF